MTFQRLSRPRQDKGEADTGRSTPCSLLSEGGCKVVCYSSARKCCDVSRGDGSGGCPAETRGAGAAAPS